MKRSCDICRKHEARWKDYRFIDACGLQGKAIVCKWCRELDDVAVTEIIRNEIDPKEFYNDRPN